MTEQNNTYFQAMQQTCTEFEQAREARRAEKTRCTDQAAAVCRSSMAEARLAFVIPVLARSASIFGYVIRCAPPFCLLVTGKRACIIYPMRIKVKR